eukprot:GHVP01053362.1.p1 GENE.GHVP01053362.1~~GHVP01053362.1.p1  ORF type:complete len:798 (+),score=108.82 GHVP01053362.1:1548-3941(+)
MRLPFLSASLAALTAKAVNNPEEYVNILQGTRTRESLSYGNVLPFVAAPWGQGFWSVESHMADVTNNRWWFHPDIPRLNGIRFTHQPSPWISDWGIFHYRFGFGGEGWDFSQGYDPPRSTWKPYHFGTELLGMATQDGGNTKLDLTATSHGSYIRFRYPKFDPDSGHNQTRYFRLSRSSAGKPLTITTIDNGIRIDAGSSWNTGGILSPDNFQQYYSIEITPMPTQIDTTESNSQVTSVYAWWDESVEETNIKTGISLISHDNCREHISTQLQGSWQEVMIQNKALWRKQLSVVEIVETGYYDDPTKEEELLQTFYSCLYRASLFPRNLGEWMQGREFHWSPYTSGGGVFEGPVMTDSGFWDSYHTIYTIQGLLWPRQLTTSIQGYLNAFNEGGWVPQWSSPGYKGSMVGTMSDVVFADVLVKGFTDFDIDMMLEALKVNAFKVPKPGDDAKGRGGLIDFRNIGFVPRQGYDAKGYVGESVSRTQNHAFCDYAILQAIDYLQSQGRNTTNVFSTEDIALLELGAQNHRNLFNTTSRYFQPKFRDGSWVDFDTLMWGRDYTEGGPKQFRWSVPHDVEWLMEQWGGEDAFCQGIFDNSNETALFRRGKDNYGTAIHEMIELQSNAFGQYSHNNQPMHHVLYLPIVAAAQASGSLSCYQGAQRDIRRTLELYSPDYFPGDEDNGEMGGWYVLSALGLYDPVPSTPDYTLGIPLFKHSRINSDAFTLNIYFDNFCKTCLVSDVTAGEGGTTQLTTKFHISPTEIGTVGELHFLGVSNDTSVEVSGATLGYIICLYLAVIFS